MLKTLNHICKSFSFKMIFLFLGFLLSFFLNEHRNIYLYLLAISPFRLIKAFIFLFSFALNANQRDLNGVFDKDVIMRLMFKICIKFGGVFLSDQGEFLLKRLFDNILKYEIV